MMHPQSPFALAPCARAPAPGQSAPRRIEAPDLRADGSRRVVLLARDRVEIARSVAGVFMRVAVRPKSFRGVALRLRDLAGAGLSYEVQLVHADPDLNVTLARADNDEDIQADWRLWARFFDLPTIVERGEGRYELERAMLGALGVGEVGPRRRGKAMTSRRARFLARRKMGDPALSARIDRGPQELFAGSKLGR